MTTIAQSKILETLRAVKLPGSKQGIDITNMITGLTVKETSEGAHVSFAIEVDPKDGAGSEPLRYAAEKNISGLAGVASVSVVLTAHKAAPQMKGRPEPNREKMSLPG